MKRMFMIVVCLLLAAVPAQTAEVKGEPKELKDPKARLSYSAGYDMAAKIKESGIELDYELVLRAARDILMNKKTLMTQQEVRDTIIAYQLGRNKELSDKNKKEGAELLAANRKREGVVTLPSGLQYQVLKEGAGRKPGPADQVRVHYRGLLVDGSEFDTTYLRNEPAVLPLDRVIKGWAEGIRLMREGSKYKFAIPAELAYGERGTPGGPIGPNAVLVFEVELLEVLPAPADAPKTSPAGTGK